MTRLVNYDIHQSYHVYTFHNKSSMYWPTNNCSAPLPGSRVTNLITNLVERKGAANNKKTIICDKFEIIHDGNVDVRVRADPIEGVANESQGHVLKPGEIWSPPFRLHNSLTFYTSSNVSQSLRLTIAGFDK